MNKTALKYISELAKHCTTYLEPVGKENSMWTGKDLKLSGVVNHKNLKDDELYPVPYEVLRDVNHKLRMKKAYNKRGKHGLVSYVAPFIQPNDRIRVESFIMQNIP